MPDPKHAMKCACALAALLCVSAPSWAARADDHRITYQNVVILQANPVHLRDVATLEYRFRLYESESPYLRDNYLGFALEPVLSPGFYRLGAAIHAAPASVVRVTGRAEAIGFFGSFDQLQSFPTPDDSHSDATLKRRGEEGAAYATRGSSFTAGLLVQNRLGPLIVRDSFELSRVQMDLNTGDEVFYEPIVDLLLPESGWSFTNQFDALWITDLGFIAGLRYSIAKAYYPGFSSDPNGPTHKLGPTLSYIFFQNPGEAFESATVFVLVNWWLKHRYRTGAAVNPAFPFISVGLAFRGQLL